MDFTNGQEKGIKILRVKFFDRKGIFRCGLRSGDSIPAGIIIGKGWKIRLEYDLDPEVID